MSADNAVAHTERKDARYGLSFGASFFLAALMFAVCAFAALLVQDQSANLASLGFSGFAVPDAVSLDKSVHQAWSVDWSSIPNIRTFLGVVLLYAPVVFFGQLYSTLINIIMLSFSAALFLSMLAKLVSSKVIEVWICSIVLVASNIYIVSCILYPNKEIPSIFLTTVLLYSLISRWLVVSIFCLFLSYWFRDGHSLILILVISVTLVRRFAFVSGGVLSVLFMLLLFLTFPISDIQFFDSSLQRNVELGWHLAGDKFTSLGEIFAFFVRLAGNALNLSFRPQLFDVDGRIYILGVGYWQFGVVLLGGILWACRNAVANNLPRSIIALAIITFLLGLSYSAFVQPRYMMPFIFPLTLGLTASALGRYTAIPAAIVFPVVFSALGLLPPPAGA